MVTYRSIVMYWGHWWGKGDDKVSTLCFNSIRRCRNRFVGAQLYRLIGARSRNEFASRCDQLHHPHHYLVPSGAAVEAEHQTNPKWCKLLDEGNQLQADCLNRLCAAFPEIPAVINDPLWGILSWDSDDGEAPATYLEQLRPHCRALASSTYRCRINAGMIGALGVPDWTHLAMPLALLRCSTRRAPQRRWLQEHFSYYLTLASLSPTYHHCFPDLWALIDQWLRTEGLGTDLTRIKWPASAKAFEYKQAVLQNTREGLMDCGWLPPGDQPSQLDLAMLWCIHMGGPQLYEKLMLSLSRGVRRCPKLLRQQMRALDPRLDVAILPRRASQSISLAPAPMASLGPD